MKFQISKELDETLSKLDRNLREQVLKKIDKVLKQPHLGKPLSKGMSGLRSERVGKYRLIYSMHPDFLVFHAFEHRKKVYGK